MTKKHPALALFMAGGAIQGYRESGEPQHLDRAVDQCQGALDALPKGDRLRGPLLAVLANAHLTRFELNRSRPDFQVAVDAAAAALAATTAESPDRLGTLGLLASLAHRRFELTGRPEDLNTAIEIGQGLTRAMPLDHPELTSHLSLLSRALRSRYELVGRVQDLELAVTVLREAFEMKIPDGERGVPGAYGQAWGADAADLCSLLLLRYLTARRAADIDEIMAIGIGALERIAPDDTSRPLHLMNLSVALTQRFELTGKLGELNLAVQFGEDAVRLGRPDGPERTTCLHNLGNALLARFERTGRAQDLDQAVALGRQTLEVSEEPEQLNHLAVVLISRFQHDGRPEDLDEAVGYGRRAVAAAEGHPAQTEVLANFAGILRVRFEHTGNQPDAEEAVLMARRALASVGPDHPRRPAFAATFSMMLLNRFEHTGAARDLQEALETSLETLTGPGLSSVDRMPCLQSLAALFQARFLFAGEVADLDEAANISRIALAELDRAHPARPTFLTNLSTILRLRFEHSGQQEDMDEAVRLAREAASAPTLMTSAWLACWFNLSSVLHARYQVTRHPQDLDESIALGLAAAAQTPPGRPGAARSLSSLCIALRMRFESTGQPADLDEAIEYGQQALAQVPISHPGRGGFLSNLAMALRLRSEQTGSGKDLDECVTLLRQALATIPAGHPHRATIVGNLAVSLRARFERGGARQDLMEAMGLARANSLDETVAPRSRMVDARYWLRCAELAGDQSEMMRACATAVEILPVLAWHGLEQPTREQHLREWTGLGQLSAAVAVAAGELEQAVEWLEACRQVLWTQTLNLRHELGALEQRAPELAARLRASRAVLDAGPSEPSTAEWRGRGQGTERHQLERRRVAARQWDSTLQEVRRLHGFDSFLRPMNFAQLREAARSGPVVLVLNTPDSSQALIVTPPSSGPGVLLVDLPGATFEATAMQVGRLLEAQQSAGDEQPGQREQARADTFDVLEWTWRNVVGPVLDALGHDRRPAGALVDWPRLWWSPSGLFTFLPLHAAGLHGRAQAEGRAPVDSTAGRVVSSYAPTLPTLIRARKKVVSEPVRPLAVGVAGPLTYEPRAVALPAVAAELAAAMQHLPSRTTVTHLTQPNEATRAAVVRELPTHTWLHLSSHGLQHPTDASQSAFYLADQPLTLADLAALNLEKADLAYLSACHTATGDQILADESLHLAAAMQLTGYRHVLATLWSIVDQITPTLADTVYAHLAHPDPEDPRPEDRLDSDRSALALHRATERLRQAYPGEPLIWAPFIHLGP